MEENKVKFALWIRPETLKKVENCYQEDDCRSRAEFIEKAINFYCGFLSAKVYGDYIPKVFLSATKANMASLEKRLANLLFKNAVEISMLTHITAASANVDGIDLKGLREACIGEVKRIHGVIPLEDTDEIGK